MPNIKSAIKRMRQNNRHRDHNRAQRSAFRTSMKKLYSMIESGQADEARAQLPLTLQIIGKTAQKGLIHQNKASRHASHLTQKVNAMGSSAEG